MKLSSVVCRIIGHKQPRNPTLVEALGEYRCRRCKALIKVPQPELLIPEVIYRCCLDAIKI